MLPEDHLEPGAIPLCDCRAQRVERIEQLGGELESVPVRPVVAASMYCVTNRTDIVEV